MTGKQNGRLMVPTAMNKYIFQQPYFNSTNLIITDKKNSKGTESTEYRKVNATQTVEQNEKNPDNMKNNKTPNSACFYFIIDRKPSTCRSQILQKLKYESSDTKTDTINDHSLYNKYVYNTFGAH